MSWAWSMDGTHLRRLRGICDQLSVEIPELRDRLHTARQILLGVVAEVRAARDTHPALTDRLAAIEARLDALQTPPTPEV